MANVHVLDIVGGQVRLVCHVPMPTGVNAVGMAFKDAYLQHHGPGTTVLKDGDGSFGTISPEEKAAVVAGDLIESVQWRIPQGDWAQLSDAEQDVILDEGFADLVEDITEQVETQFYYYGFTRTAPNG